MILINLVGPPCSGKSYLASRYALEHEWVYLSIDGYRSMCSNDKDAWFNFKQSIRVYSDYPTIIESSGLSWRMPEIYEANKDRIITFLLLANRKELHRRLKERVKKVKASYQLARDEEQSIDWVLENLDKYQIPIDKIIRTDNYNKEELYELFNNEMLNLEMKGK